MKKILSLIILIVTICNASASDTNVQLGVRIGGGWAMQQVKLNSLWGVSTSYSEYKNRGYTIPIKLEVLAGFKRIRLGYTLEYAYSNFTNNEIYTESKSPAPPYTTIESRIKSTTPIPLNFVANAIVLEYVSYTKKRFSISPSAKLGFFASQGIVKQDFRDESKPKWQAGLAVGASLNFEVKDKKETSYVFAPTYSFYTGGAAQRIWGQSIGLDIAFRFRLNKKQVSNTSPKLEHFE
ncbi:MAG: hypothetical protein JST49_03595 [Bacteroidetes bacterium]|nr:hypothetical protein [Bacteroidota bacterium]